MGHTNYKYGAWDYSDETDEEREARLKRWEQEKEEKEKTSGVLGLIVLAIIAGFVLLQIGLNIDKLDKTCLIVSGLTCCLIIAVSFTMAKKKPEK